MPIEWTLRLSSSPARVNWRLGLGFFVSVPAWNHVRSLNMWWEAPVSFNPQSPVGIDDDTALFEHVQLQLRAVTWGVDDNDFNSFIACVSLGTSLDETFRLAWFNGDVATFSVFKPWLECCRWVGFWPRHLPAWMSFVHFKSLAWKFLDLAQHKLGSCLPTHSVAVHFGSEVWLPLLRLKTWSWVAFKY